MSEFNKCLIVLWCAIHYWLGGQELPFFGRGFKMARRYIMPLGLWIMLLAFTPKSGGNPVVLKASLACLALSLATHLGYKASLLRYAVVGLALGVGSLIIKPYWTFLLPCVFHTALGYASLRDNRFQWGYVAILTGASIGIAYSV